jgi:hypothetical protein
MNDIEQDLLRRVLVDLFLATPRNRTQLHQRENPQETRQKTSTTAQRTRSHRRKNAWPPVERSKKESIQ